MKKIALAVIILAILCASAVDSYAASAPAKSQGSAKSSNSKYSLKINNELIPVDVPPLMIDNHSMVPVRAVFEKLGGAVTWNASIQKMTISLNGTKMEFKADDSKALVNGKTVKMEGPAKKVDNRLLMPLGFFDKNLNMNVGWYPKDNLVTIDTLGNVKDVQYLEDEGKEQVVISLDWYRNCNIVRLTDPDRVVVDFPSTNAPAAEKKLDAGGDLVKSASFVRSGKAARIVIYTGGQPQYEAENGKNQVVLTFSEPGYRNIRYVNQGDRVGFILEGAELTEGGAEIKPLYKGKYDASGKKYTVTFPEKLASLGSGLMKINDGVLDSVEVVQDGAARQTRIVFSAKEKYFYEIVARPEVDDTAITLLKPAAKSERLVVIDAGHGGKETGAIYGDAYEKNLNLDIALRLNKLLKGKNVKTYLTRSDDSYVGLYERAFVANDLKARLFLSVHNNAIDDPGYGGTMTLYYPSQRIPSVLNSIRFAQIIQGKLLGRLKTTDRKIIQRPGLVVLKATDMTASLAEVAFMTNSRDRSNLLRESFRQNAAAGLCDAVVQALKEDR